MNSNNILKDHFGSLLIMIELTDHVFDQQGLLGITGKCNYWIFLLRDSKIRIIYDADQKNGIANMNPYFHQALEY
jgi:hypothetical protein